MSSTTTIYNTVYVPKPSSSTFPIIVQTLSVVPVSTVVKAAVTAVTVVPSGSPVKPSAAQFTGGAEHTASLGVGGILTVVLCMAGWALM